jgi:hypothetical protein
MAKKKQYTYADEAKAIGKRFPRREFDTIEMRDYKQAMNQLMESQEEIRESLGMDNPDAMACGGKMKYEKGGNYMKRIENSPDQTILDSYQPFADSSSLDPMKTLSPIDQARMELESRQLSDKAAFGNNDNNKYIPSLISGASNVAGNLLLAGLSKKGQPKLSSASAVPQKINLEPQAEQLRRDAATSKSVALRNARNMGVNAGQALGIMGAVGAGINRDLGRNLTSLYMQQEGANVGAANQFNLANTATRNRTNLVNAQIKQQGLQDRLGYFSGALGTIPGVMQDINMMNADEETRKMYLRYLNTLGRNYRYTGNIFGPGSMGYNVRG